ncbi:hypothetical protein C3L33_23533, partial [Rhododendron williamsianum]
GFGRGQEPVFVFASCDYNKCVILLDSSGGCYVRRPPWRPRACRLNPCTLMGHRHRHRLCFFGITIPPPPCIILLDSVTLGRPDWRTSNIVWARIWSKIIQADGSNTTPPRSSSIEIRSSLLEVSHTGTLRPWLFPEHYEVSSGTECRRASSVLLCASIDCSLWRRLYVGSPDASGIQGGRIGSFDLVVDRGRYTGRIRASCEEVSENLEWVFGRVKTNQSIHYFVIVPFLFHFFSPSLEHWAFELLVLLAGLMPQSEISTSLLAM